MQVYPLTFDFTFNHTAYEIDKWAALEVVNFDDVPQGMETFMLEGGLYAVFDYQGLSTAQEYFNTFLGSGLRSPKIIAWKTDHILSIRR